MQNLTKRLDNLEKTERLIMRPVREWATPELCRLLTESTLEQLGPLMPDKATLDLLIGAIREHAPSYAMEASHAKH